MSEKKKVAVFVIMGQSNATGHDLPMREEDKILTPLTNVFGLDRKYNQSFEKTELFWTGYTSGGMNLAEEQDHTYSIPNCLAALWQKHIDDGNALGLPDLYIIQIAIGSQGVTDGYMWNPDRKEKLIPGKLGVADISLFPFAKHIFSLIGDSFAQKEMEYEVIGLHWRGGEEDVFADKAYLEKNLEGIYVRIIDVFNELLDAPPVILHKLVCPHRMEDEDPTGKALVNMHYSNEVFYRLEAQYPNVSVFDPTTAPYFIPDVRGNGMFKDDMVHFTPEMNRWIADSVMRKKI